MHMLCPIADPFVYHRTGLFIDQLQDGPVKDVSYLAFLCNVKSGFRLVVANSLLFFIIYFILLCPAVCTHAGAVIYTEAASLRAPAGRTYVSFCSFLRIRYSVAVDHGIVIYHMRF